MFWELPQFVAEIEVEESRRDALQRAVARKIEERWASVSELCQALQRPVPRVGVKVKESKIDLELFRSVETPHDGPVDLWREIPAGECWIGSPESSRSRLPQRVRDPRWQFHVLRRWDACCLPSQMAFLGRRLGSGFPRPASSTRELGHLGPSDDFGVSLALR